MRRVGVAQLRMDLNTLSDIAQHPKGCFAVHCTCLIGLDCFHLMATHLMLAYTLDMMHD